MTAPVKAWAIKGPNGSYIYLGNTEAAAWDKVPSLYPENLRSAGYTAVEVTVIEGAPVDAKPAAWLIESEDGRGGFITCAVTEQKAAFENSDRGQPIPLYSIPIDLDALEREVLREAMYKPQFDAIRAIFAKHRESAR